MANTRLNVKPGRNDPCPCGSGKKFKKCCHDKLEGHLDLSSIAPKKAIPSLAEMNQIVALYNEGHYVELESQARLLVEQYANSGFAWKVLGTSLWVQGKEALPALYKATEFLPNDAEVYNNLGNALRDLGQFDKAVACYRRALELQPDFAEAHNNLGNALQDLGQLDSAVACYHRALESRPRYAEAHANFGNALTCLGQLDNAAACYRRALEINPGFVEAQNNLGNTLKNLGQLDNAVACFRQALEINPNYAEVHVNLGNTFKYFGQLDNAVACYQQALAIKPNLVEAHNNLGYTLKDLGQLDNAVACLRRALEIKPDYFDAHSNLLLVLNYYPDRISSLHLEQARQFGRVAASKASERFSTWKCTSRPERLRVGLVSGDLLNHPVGYFLEGVLSQISPSRIELIAYSTNHKEDELTARIRPYFSSWKQLVGKNDAAAARQIHDDGVHVLLDLSGHTEHNRLPVFAWKPAPVQASWLGYFATTGIAEMDYFIADEESIPVDQRNQFTESIRYLTDTRLCFTSPSLAVPVAPLPASSNGKITFGCFQNLAKVGDDVLAAWGKILASLPNSRLRMQCKQLGEPALAEQMRLRLQLHGIAPSRVELHGSVSRNDYLSAHAEVDIILDTFPYPGGTTTCEALWMGVPTLTLAGDRLLARQGASLLKAAGLGEWVTENIEDYVAKAITFSTDLPKLIALRASLRQQVSASPIFDTRSFARNFEDALWGMWENHITHSF